MVYSHYRYSAVDKLDNLRVTIIYTGYYHSVKLSYPTELTICNLPSANPIRYKRNTVSQDLCLRPDSLKNPRKILMCKTRVSRIYKQNTYVIGSVRLKCNRSHVRYVSKLSSLSLNHGLSLFTYIAVTIECLTHCCNRYITCIRYVLYGYHSVTAFPNWYVGLHWQSHRCPHHLIVFACL